MTAAVAGVRLRSATPSRQRWDVCALVGRGDLARRVEALIAATPGVNEVRANPRTGRVLLRFDDHALDTGNLLRRALREAQDRTAGAGTADSASGKTGSAAPDPLLELLNQFRPDRAALAKAPAWSVANNVLNFMPELGLVAIVNVVNNNPLPILAKVGLGTVQSQLVFLGVFTAAAFGAELVAERKKRDAWRKLSRELEHRVRTRTYEHVQDLDLSFIETQTSGGLVRVLSEHIANINRFLETGADDMLQRAITALVIVVTLLLVSPTLALTALAPLPIIMLGSRYVQRKTAKPFAEMGEANDRLHRILSNNLADLGTIKSFTSERREAERLRAVSDEVRLASDAATATSGRYTDLMRLMISLSFATSMTVGGFLVAGKTVSPALFTLLLFFVPKLLVRMEGMGEGFDLYKNAVASSDQILNLLKVRPTVVSGGRSLDPAAVKGGLSFRGVEFAYRPGHPVFEDFDLEIRPHQTVAFVGATGSGKSSLVKLMMRFYDVTGGTIELDGVDLRELNLIDLRRAIGFVSQDVYLFDGTIRENILYGRPDASQEELEAAAHAAEAHGFITALPQGYDTPVGERGKTLSGGQRQRISIARTVLKDPPILILDEATSAVDNETEAAIQRSIEHISKGRTTVVIAHRLSTVRNADVIYVMDDGRIVEHGSHTALLARGGLYANLWRVQTGDSVGTRRKKAAT